MFSIEKNKIIKKSIECVILLGCIFIIFTHADEAYKFHEIKPIVLAVLIMIVAIFMANVKKVNEITYSGFMSIKDEKYYTSEYEIAKHLTIAPFGPMMYYDPVEAYY